MKKIIFELNSKKDKFLEKSYRRAMRELDKFFEIRWKNNTPKIILLKNRKEIDDFRENKTERWCVGWAKGGNVFLLDRKNYEKESCHKYSDKEYFSLLKHELCHLFFSCLSKNNSRPYWLNEGIAIYLSGQLSQKENPKKFKRFLKFYSNSNKGVYQESGFVVKLLIKKFGKRNLLKLIKSLKKIKSEEEFEKQFKKIYNLDLNYKEINRL